MLVLSNRIFLKNRAQCKTVISHGFFSIFLVYHLKNYITSVNVNILLYIFRNTADKMGLNDAIVEKELLQILIVSPVVTQLVDY